MNISSRPSSLKVKPLLFLLLEPLLLFTLLLLDDLR
jgi:hypothetical protein